MILRMLVSCALFAGAVAFADQNEDLRTTQEKSKRTPITPPAASESIQDSKVEKLTPKQGDVAPKSEPAKKLSCSPNRVSPGQIGLKCARVEPGSDLAKAGIVAGDVVMSIDGESLSTETSAAILYAKLKTHQFSEIRVLRNGKEVVLR